MTPEKILENHPHLMLIDKQHIEQIAIAAMKEYGNSRFEQGRDAALDRLSDNWKFFSKDELEGQLDSLKQDPSLQP